MKIESITLQNYRSWKKKTFEFSPYTTLIIGSNTAGKTNIIEAIYSLATAKSFRADIESEVVSWEEEIGRVKGNVSDTSLELVVTKGLVGGKKTPIKKYLVNGVARRALDFLGNFRAVLFWPEDLELIIGSPSVRRRYLDRVLVQVDREYRRNLFSYERGLRQRNKLLFEINEGRASRNQLMFWNQLLIKSGGYITDIRIKFIDYVNLFNKDNLNFVIDYDKSVISESRLDQYKDEEISAKATLVGPHRDDFIINKFKILNPKSETNLKSQIQNTKLDLSKYGSRGEQRMGVLWLKLAELSFVQEKVADQPVLLLDDIFSELDNNSRKTVLDLINNRQTVITTAESDVVEVLENSQVQFDIIRI